MPKVSVLMPVYKTEEKYLRQAIESVLAQSFTDFEFLILDDCPNDDRHDIVKSYHDSRIKYFKNDTNLGISKSRNKLIELAQGEYLAIVDHDDISMPIRFARQVAYLDTHPDIGVVGGQAVFISNNREFNHPSEDYEIKLALMHFCVVTHPSAMIRKAVLIKTNLRYEEQFSPAEDYALWCRLIPLTKFHNLNDEILLRYNDHANNTTHHQTQKMHQATVAIQAFVKQHNPDLYAAFLERAEHIISVRILGIKIIVKRIQGGRTRYYLFNKIPIISIRRSFKI